MLSRDGTSFSPPASGNWWWGTAWRLVLPAVLAVCLFSVAIFAIILPAFENIVMERKREMIKELTQMAHQTLTYFYQKVENGELTTKEAQEQVLDLLGKYRYGPDLKDYFWINDQKPRIVMHPYRPDLEGRDVSQMADPTGKYLFVEFVRQVEKEGDGYVDYMWQWMDAPGKVVPKVSYVRGFAPWGWIVGTGVYIEDVKAEMEAMITRLSTVSLVILLVITLLSAYLISQNVRSQVRRFRAEERVQESRRMLRLVMDSIPQYIYWKERSGTYLGCNPGFARLVGLTRPDLIIGLGDDDLTWPADLIPDREGEILVLEQGQAETHVVRPYTGPDGRTCWLDINRVPLLDGRGQVVGLLGAMEDITERRNTVEAMVESERRFRTLVENSLVGIFIVQDRVVRYMNPEQKRLFGEAPEPFCLSDYKDAPADDLEKMARLDENLNPESGWPLEMELRMFPYRGMNSGQGMRWVHLRASPIAYQRAKALLVIMMDITQTKELEHLLLIQDKMASLGRVAAGIAHEIRNPLSGINMYLTALEDVYFQSFGPEENQVRQILEKIKSSSRKIEKVIKRVLDFSKPTRPNLAWIQVNDIIEQVIDFSAVTLRKNSIKLEKSLAAGLPPCHVDGQLIEQVLVNLITNAVQALTGQNTGKALLIASFLEKDRVVIKVADSGPGIAPEIRSRIFDPFFTIKKDGSGIGLSLSHRIITDHGGTLTVSTSRWGGAEFTMELPAMIKAWYDSVG